MNHSALTDLMAILTAVIGIAILSVIVSKQSNTVGVLNAGGTAFSNILKTALSPITGTNGFSLNTGSLSLPSF